VLSDLKKPI
jgi:hypothetical protein